MKLRDIIILAERHGLQLHEEMSFNEMGIDFRVGFATDTDGTKWVLRIPRRTDLADQIEGEKNILRLVKKYLQVAVPDWTVASPTLVAYPLLAHKPVLTYDTETYEVTWHMDQHAPQFVPSLARALMELHQIPVNEARVHGLKVQTPEQFRQEILADVETVKHELSIGAELETRWRTWLDNDRLWPDFNAFVHGDLYAGHILAAENGEVTGIIDWSEGQVSDPSIDFSGHLTVFGADSLKELIRQYEQRGGRVWETLFEQTVERQAAAPLRYAVFAIKTADDKHIEAAKAQLGLV